MDALRRRRWTGRDLFDLSLPHHALYLFLDSGPLLVLDELFDRQRENGARPAPPADPPVDDRVCTALADVDEADGAALLFHLTDQAIRREGRKRGARAEELRRFFDEMFRVAPCERFERFTEKDDAL